MSDKEIQSIIDRSIAAGKTAQKKSTLNKITVGVAISVISISVITFFSSFYGVRKAVDKIGGEFVNFKNDTEKEIVEMKKDINTNWNTNFTQAGQIKYLEGKSDRGSLADLPEKTNN